MWKWKLHVCINDEKHFSLYFPFSKWTRNVFLASNVENLQFNLLCGRVDGKGSNVAIVLLVGENFPQKVSRKVNFQNFSKRKNDNKKIRSLWV